MPAPRGHRGHRHRRLSLHAASSSAAAAALPHPQLSALAINRGEVRFGARLGTMRPCNHLLDDPSALRTELAARGYIYLKHVLPADEVEAARAAIGAELEAAGVVASNSAAMPMAPVVEDSTTAGGDYHMSIVKGLNLEHHPALHTLGESPSLEAFFDHIFEEPCVASSWKRIRPIAPGGYSG